MILELITSVSFQLRLEPIGSDDRFPSVAFRVEANMDMPSWRATLIAKECWFSYQSLNDFEAALKELIRKPVGIASLVELGGSSTVTITKNEDALSTEINMQDTMNCGTSKITVNGFASEITEIIEKLREYPKWW